LVLEDFDGSDSETDDEQPMSRKSSFLGAVASKLKKVRSASHDVTPASSYQASEASESEAEEQGDNRNANSVIQLSVKERKAALAALKNRKTERGTWEYVAPAEWYHPQLGSQTIAAIIAEKPQGAFAIYGRKHCFLCVNLGSSLRHDAIEHDEQLGFRLMPQDFPAQPWHKSLQAMIEYYSEPQVNAPYLLKFVASTEDDALSLLS
jgi:hypothetical protein